MLFAPGGLNQEVPGVGAPQFEALARRDGSPAFLM